MQRRTPLSAWHSQGPVWEFDSDCVHCVVFSLAGIREEWLKIAVELMSEGVLCLWLGCLCCPRYVRCVSSLYVINQTVADHDTRGAGPSSRDEECFVESWGKEGIIIFCET